MISSWKEETEFWNAVLKNNIDDVKKLIEKFNINPNCTNNGGCTAMHTAAKKGNKELVILLAGYGGDINKVNNDSETPLHLAVQGCNEEIVRWLLLKGANIEIKNSANKTPEELAHSLQLTTITQIFNLTKVINAKTFDNHSTTNTIDNSINFVSNIFQTIKPSK